MERKIQFLGLLKLSENIMWEDTAKIFYMISNFVGLSG
jgi:hypothetical protein